MPPKEVINKLEELRKSKFQFSDIWGNIEDGEIEHDGREAIVHLLTAIAKLMWNSNINEEIESIEGSWRSGRRR